MVDVSLCVPHEIPLVVKRVPTNLAAVRRREARLPPVTRLVAPAVPPQLRALAESFPAGFAAELCCPSGVDLHVALQRTCVTELLLAGAALERFLRRVDPHVCQHVAFLVKDFAADVAAKGFFSSVKPQMRLLGPDRGELLATDIAGPAAFPVRLQV